MTKLLFIASLFFTLQLSAQRDTFYCIQIMATHNPDMIRAEHLTETLSDVYLQAGEDIHRVLVVHETMDEAEIMLHTWRRLFKDAFIVVRTREDIGDMLLLYTFD